jgi:hypothetical protein
MTSGLTHSDISGLVAIKPEPLDFLPPSPTNSDDLRIIVDLVPVDSGIPFKTVLSRSNATKRDSDCISPPDISNPLKQGRQNGTTPPQLSMPMALGRFAHIVAEANGDFCSDTCKVFADLKKFDNRLNPAQITKTKNGLIIKCTDEPQAANLAKIGRLAGKVVLISLH